MSAITKASSLQEYYFQERCFITELLNEASCPGISIAQARVEPGVTTVLHALKSIEIYYILTGHGEVYVGEEKDNVGPGDLVKIAPNVPQAIKNIGTEDLKFLAICSPRFQVEDYREVE